MNTKPQWKKLAMAAAMGSVLGLTACSTTRATESVLLQAGFRQLPADTPSKMAHLQTVPDHRLIARVYKGQTYYIFVDASGCRCLFIGNAQQYQAYLGIVQDLRAQESGAINEAAEWEIENSGLQSQ